jgi:hypothetical protein
VCLRTGPPQQIYRYNLYIKQCRFLYLHIQTIHSSVTESLSKNLNLKLIKQSCHLAMKHDVCLQHTDSARTLHSICMYVYMYIHTYIHTYICVDTAMHTSKAHCLSSMASPLLFQSTTHPSMYQVATIHQHNTMLGFGGSTFESGAKVRCLSWGLALLPGRKMEPVLCLSWSLALLPGRKMEPVLCLSCSLALLPGRKMEPVLCRSWSLALLPGCKIKLILCLSSENS